MQCGGAKVQLCADNLQSLMQSTSTRVLTGRQFIVHFYLNFYVLKLKFANKKSDQIATVSIIPT